MRPTTLMPERSFPPLGRCMYCLESGDAVNLTREHLIPEGIGGKWSVDKAVCDTCKSIVNPPETIVIQQDFHSARVALEVRRKRQNRKDRERGPLLPRPVFLNPAPELGAPSGIKYQPSIDETPALVLLSFGDPPRLSDWGRTSGEFPVCAVFVALSGKNRPPAQSVGIDEPFHPQEYAYSLAKWAYSFAVAERGLYCCDSAEIRALLIGGVGDAMSFVGMRKGLPPSRTSLHWMSLREQSRLLVCTVHLFASAGFTAYDVVVGPIRGAA